MVHITSAHVPQVKSSHMAKLDIIEAGSIILLKRQYQKGTYMDGPHEWRRESIFLGPIIHSTVHFFSKVERMDLDIFLQMSTHIKWENNNFVSLSDDSSCAHRQTT